MNKATAAVLILSTYIFTSFSYASDESNSDNRCPDNQSEMIRKALKIGEAGKQKRKILQCVLKEWPRESSPNSSTWILVVVEFQRRVKNSYVYTVGLATKSGPNKSTINAEGKPVQFRIKWKKDCNDEMVTMIDTAKYFTGHGSPAFGIRVRGDYSYKLESHWREKLILMSGNYADGIIPFFSTDMEVCNCWAKGSSEWCFNEKKCPEGCSISRATLAIGKNANGRTSITKVETPSNTKLVFQFTNGQWGHTDWGGDESPDGFYLTPLEKANELEIETLSE